MADRRRDTAGTGAGTSGGDPVPGRGTDGGALTVDVDLRRGELHLVVSLRAQADEVIAVVGPNGAGKSTLLAAVAGLLPVDDGRIALDGRVLDDPRAGTFLPAERRRVGVVFQDALLLPHLDAAANVAFGLRAAGIDRRAAAVTARRWLEVLGVGELAARRPAQLSGGQAQRVAIARALAPAPAALLLDEPFAALDAGSRAALRRDLRPALRAAAEPGPDPAGYRPGAADGDDGAAAGRPGREAPPTGVPPTVVVTHDPLDALALADRLVVLEGGRVAQAGPVDEVVRRPRTRHVADLVGTNLYRGTASGTSIAIDGGGALVSAETHQGTVFALVPPGAVVLHLRAPDGSARNRWPAVVEGIESLGERVRVHLVGAPPVVAEVTPAAVAELGLAPGVAVWASVKATEVTAYLA